MTAYEIESSGVYEASKFSIILKSGDVIILMEDLPNHRFFTFNTRENTLQSYIYFDARGRHDKHITIKGNDILKIKILASKKEGQRIHNNWQMFSYLALIIVILICLYQSCH